MDASFSPARVQGRPSRNGNTAGPNSVVTGLRKAVQELRSTNVTRKDIARFAGVTPALVTYYFPDRNTLLKTATLPIVDIYFAQITGHLAADIDHGQKLFHIIEDTLALYHDNHYVVELAQQTHGIGLMQQAWQQVAEFFDVWPGRASSHERDGWFFATVLFGTCCTLSSRLVINRIKDYDLRASREAQVAMIYSILTSSLSGSTEDPSSTPL